MRHFLQSWITISSAMACAIVKTTCLSEEEQPDFTWDVYGLWIWTLYVVLAYPSGGGARTVFPLTYSTASELPLSSSARAPLPCPHSCSCCWGRIRSRHITSVRDRTSPRNKVTAAKWTLATTRFSTRQRRLVEQTRSRCSQYRMSVVSDVSWTFTPSGSGYSIGALHKA